MMNLGHLAGFHAVAQAGGIRVGPWLWAETAAFRKKVREKTK
jgi:hypothetical protein